MAARRQRGSVVVAASERRRRIKVRAPTQHAIWTPRSYFVPVSFQKAATHSSKHKSNGGSRRARRVFFGERWNRPSASRARGDHTLSPMGTPDPGEIGSDPQERGYAVRFGRLCCSWPRARAKEREECSPPPPSPLTPPVALIPSPPSPHSSHACAPRRPCALPLRPAPSPPAPRPFSAVSLAAAARRRAARPPTLKFASTAAGSRMITAAACRALCARARVSRRSRAP